MNGELAQAVVLVAHGNAALATGQVTEALERSNSTFLYVGALSLEVPDGDGASWVASTLDWFEALHRAEVERLWLTAGGTNPGPFVNAGRWGLLGQAQEGALVWSPRWQRSSGNGGSTGSGAGGWAVAYSLTRHDGAPSVPPADVGGTAARLALAIREARDFARTHDLQPFDTLFDEALSLGASAAPDAPYHGDMLPVVGYSLEARRLLAMATRGWVFGGMGSWNDVWFRDARDHEEYSGITARLYRAVLDGIRDATNAFHVD